MVVDNPASLPSLADLEQNDDFLSRHIGPDGAQISTMLAAVGAASLDALIAETVPSSILDTRGLALPGPVAEHAALQRLGRLAAENTVVRSLIGCGYHDTITPGVIQRNVLENPGWYTAYTPYQPEISQGRLEGLLNFQQMVIDLSGLPLANASLLDEGTAAAEAMTLCKRSVKRNNSHRFFVASDCHPQTIAVLRTRAEPFGFEIIIGDPDTDLAGLDIFGALLQYPGTDGRIRDLRPIIEKVHAANALAVVAADIMSLLLLESPGRLGADVAIGNTQRFGVPMGFGGPHAAYFATREEFKRSVPGRIIGVSIDVHGNQALRMAMQTREQHIRREKATSNICTSQALLALMAGFYATYHGPARLLRIAQRIHRLTRMLAIGLEAAGVRPLHDRYFDTLCIGSGKNTDAIMARALDSGFNLRRISDTEIGISLDERSNSPEVLRLIAAIGGIEPPALETLEAASATPAIPQGLNRSDTYLSHPVFNRYHCETDMLRYLRRLEDKDIALNRAMIPLGSCTMKLNASAEMAPITWPAFAQIHPFAPADQTRGYQQMIGELAAALLECTGYDAMSFQPNSGAQGEYAGLLAIRHYHRSRGETHRTICLIPSSAHGTNPASAVMAGMQVVLVRCDENGNVDVGDLRRLAEQHSRELAALMVTYPSTHGVFEQAITEICDIIHTHGGQVYLDGANLNALVGIARPGHFGADVSHLNLHKTFCIPHGGGGPGMGPIGVRAHLAPFLPGHVITPQDVSDNQVAVSSAAFGSASILPISWMYCTMMGAEGLRRATQVAILSANYIASRLRGCFDILYTGGNGRVAHECIIDIRPIKEATGISEEDIAKRLIDYGFHAPTMSFPVPGTLMIEPTESEPLSEIDRFCDAMLAIYGELSAVRTGLASAEDNVLRNAPHTQQQLLAGDWAHPYTREQAAYPVPSLRENKYWAPVGRLDNVWGDRHLFCSCPMPESYATLALQELTPESA